MSLSGVWNVLMDIVERSMHADYIRYVVYQFEHGASSVNNTSCDLVASTYLLYEWLVQSDWYSCIVVLIFKPSNGGWISVWNQGILLKGCFSKCFSHFISTVIWSLITVELVHFHLFKSSQSLEFDLDPIHLSLSSKITLFFFKWFSSPSPLPVFFG